MKHVNGDMEDLFRRAAAKYPLRTDRADWDRLAADLDKDPGPPSDPDEEDERRRRGFFWWWLLLPLAGVLGFYGWRATVHQPAHLSNAVITAPAAMPGGKAAGATQDGGATAVGRASGGTQGTATQRAEASGGGAVTTVGTQGGGTTAVGTSSGEAQTDRTTSGDRKRKRLTGSTAKAGNRDGGSMTGDANKDMFDAAKMGGVDGGDAMGGQNGMRSQNAMGRQDANRPLLLTSPDWRRASTAGSFNLVVDVKAPVRKDSSAKQPKKATAKNTGHGYIGISGAPDLSTVKMQSMKGVGTTWGLLLGYAFNDRWAVESGVYLDRKKYYTAGEYFKGANLYPGVTLQTVDGTCNMWEVPLNVRYTFNPGSKIAWFATAGFSSYFMTKQKYSYDLETAGYSWNKDSSISAHSNYLFSIVNLSAGFERRIGSIGNLRIEPYLRIPLSGIGSGRLPIMSAGINIGITRRLW